MSAMAIFVGTTAFLFSTVYGGDSSVTCSIVTANPFNYTCSAMGILTTTEMESIAATNFGCAQTTISGISGSDESVVLSYGCDDISSSFVIQCIAFAGEGEVGGACTQMFEGAAETCDFKENPDGSFVWLPEEIGTQCIGQQKCEITSNYNGFEYDGTSYDVRTQTASGQSNNLEDCCANAPELKFKFVVLCGSVDAAGDHSTTDYYQATTTGYDDGDQPATTGYSSRLSLFWALFILMAFHIWN